MNLHLININRHTSNCTSRMTESSIDQGRGEAITQEADLARVAKAKRWSGLIDSFEWTNNRIPCLMESRRVSGRPLAPVVFSSTVDSASTSTQNKMSSLSMRDGGRVYRGDGTTAAVGMDPSPSTPSIIVRCRRKGRVRTRSAESRRGRKTNVSLQLTRLDPYYVGFDPYGPGPFSIKILGRNRMTFFLFRPVLFII